MFSYLLSGVAKSSSRLGLFTIPVAHVSKYISKARSKRLPLTTKRAGKGYYKGNRCRSEGRHTSKGKFFIQPEKRTELVVPDLSDFKLKAYVGYGVKPDVRVAATAK